MSERAIFDGVHTAEHHDPLSEGAVTAATAGLTTGKILAAGVQKLRTPGPPNADLSKKGGLRDMMFNLLKAIRDCLGKGRATWENFRKSADRETEKPKEGNTSDTPDKKNKKSDPEINHPDSEKEGTRSESEKSNKKADKVDDNVNDTLAKDVVSSLLSSANIDDAAKIWSLAAPEAHQHEFAEHVTVLAENRMRELDPKLMAAFDQERTNGADRATSMEHAAASHPAAGDAFRAAMSTYDQAHREAKDKRLEAHMVNGIEDAQTHRVRTGKAPFNPEELREELKACTSRDGGRIYSDAMVDKVLDPAYTPSEGVLQARYDLRDMEAARRQAPKVTLESSPDAAKADEAAPRAAAGPSTGTPAPERSSGPTAGPKGPTSGPKGPSAGGRRAPITGRKPRPSKGAGVGTDRPRTSSPTPTRTATAGAGAGR